MAVALQREALLFSTGAIVSCALHLCVLIGVPLLLQLTRRDVNFERPQTFQLVNAPPSLRPYTPAAQKKLTKTPVSKKIKKAGATPVPKESAKKEENVDELASLLEDLPEQASVSQVNNVKYDPYINAVQQKIMQYWVPAKESRADSVIVAFTIARDGSISEPSIVGSSGDQTLETLALRAVKRAAPFSKIPATVADGKYECNFAFYPRRN
jgi:TonB family protein